LVNFSRAYPTGELPPDVIGIHITSKQQAGFEEWLVANEG
jgi:hypothetical protein